MDISDKETLRKAMLLQREALLPEAQAQAALAIAERLFTRKEIQAPSDIGLYWSFRGEVPTQNIINRLIGLGHRIFLPRLGLKGIEFAQIRDEEDLVPGTFGILEPNSEIKAVAISQLAVLIVPGVAFDLHGARLGRGKGQYDRVLQNYWGRRFALAYEFQLVEAVPRAAWDEGVQVILTEHRSIEVLADRA